jgi:hypothetical protein
MTPIDTPGIYDVPFSVYHGKEICVGPSISSSGLRKITECPLKYWWNSPLNPNRPPESNETHFAIGKAAHDLILDGTGWPDRYHVLPEGFTRAGTKKWADAIAEADAAEAEGKTVLKHSDHATVVAMAEAIKKHPINRALSRGKAEATIVWQDEQTGVWLRCRPDFLPDDRRFIPDLKTTTDASPTAFEKSVANFGYHQQAALYLDGLAAVFGEDESREFYFIAQEKEPPYIVQPYQLDAESIAWGRRANRVAINKFAWCVKNNRWPSYADDFIKIGLPYWKTKEHEATLQGVSL